MNKNASYGSFIIAAALIVAATLLVIHVFYYYPFDVDDDTFISLRYAARLLAGHGLTWNDGERVEGYSNLLWVLLTAGLGRMGFDLLGAALMLDIACGIITLLAFFYYAQRNQLGMTPLAAGLLVYIAAPPVALCMIGGLESPLVMALFSWAVVLTCRLMQHPNQKLTIMIGVLLGLLCLTQPEGPLYSIAIALGWLFTAPQVPAARLRTIILIGGTAFVFYVAQLIFRLAYYGEWVSNTTLAKVTFTPEHVIYGLTYALGAFLCFLPVLIYNAFAGWGTKEQSEQCRDNRFILIACAAISAAIIMGGGDNKMGGLRFFLPLIPPILIVFMNSVDAVLKKSASWSAYAMVAYIILCQFWVQSAIDVNPHREWTRHARAIGEALAARFSATQPLIAVAAAGAIPYYSELPAIDIFGLNDAYLTQHRYDNKRFGKYLIGHDLFDPDYVKKRRPDILVFDVPGKGGPGSVCKSFNCKDLLNDYREDTLLIPGYRVPIWLRKQDAKVSTQ